jgi:hypothetical protein
MNKLEIQEILSMRNMNDYLKRIPNNLLSKSIKIAKENK